MNKSIKWVVKVEIDQAGEELYYRATDSLTKTPILTPNITLAYSYWDKSSAEGLAQIVEGRAVPVALRELKEAEYELLKHTLGY